LVGLARALRGRNLGTLDLGRIQRLPLSLSFVYLRLVCFHLRPRELPLAASMKSPGGSRPRTRFGGPLRAGEGVVFASPNGKVTGPLAYPSPPARPALSSKHDTQSDLASLPLTPREKRKEQVRPGRLCQQMLSSSQLITTTLPSWSKHSRPLHHPAYLGVTRLRPFSVSGGLLEPGAIRSRLQQNTTHKRSHHRSTSACREGKPLSHPHRVRQPAPSFVGTNHRSLRGRGRHGARFLTRSLRLAPGTLLPVEIQG